MSKELIIFEDKQYSDFYPLTHLRPTYFLRAGIRDLHQIISDYFADYKINLVCREELAELTAEMTGCPVNKSDMANAGEIVIINGRLKPDQNLYQALQKADAAVVLKSGDNFVGAKLFKALTPDAWKCLLSMDYDSLIAGFKSQVNIMNIDVKFYGHLWDFVNDIDRAIGADTRHLKNNPKAGDSFIFGSSKDISMAFPGVVFINAEDILVSRDAQILPGAVLNASDGPIVLDSEVYVEPHTYLIGPVYVGRRSRLVGGKITGCSIGPVCRAGGEVEETIIQGYTNKYHAGFLGHAYVGEWVNFGAMTTNSDLRNDYKNVSVSVNGVVTDTGGLKVGSFIGDYTKTAIGTLLNTGINIGVACNILGDGLVAEKEIPSFTWYSSKQKHEYKISKALETIEKTMSRRDVKLSLPLKSRLEEVYKYRQG